MVLQSKASVLFWVAQVSFIHTLLKESMSRRLPQLLKGALAKISSHRD